MSLIGKVAFGCAYLDGDFMYPFFKWCFIVVFVATATLCSYAHFVVAPVATGLENVSIWTSFLLWLSSILEAHWWLWLAVPVGIAFLVGFVFAGICLEIAKWFIRTFVDGFLGD